MGMRGLRARKPIQFSQHPPPLFESTCYLVFPCPMKFTPCPSQNWLANIHSHVMTSTKGFIIHGPTLDHPTKDRMLEETQSILEGTPMTLAYSPRSQVCTLSKGGKISQTMYNVDISATHVILSQLCQVFAKKTKWHVGVQSDCRLRCVGRLPCRKRS